MKKYEVLGISFLHRLFAEREIGLKGRTEPVRES